MDVGWNTKEVLWFFASRRDDHLHLGEVVEVISGDEGLMERTPCHRG